MIKKKKSKKERKEEVGGRKGKEGRRGKALARREVRDFIGSNPLLLTSQAWLSFSLETTG